MKFLLPGIFLFILGIGNLAVGHYKGGQYDEVISELKEKSLPLTIKEISPMERIRVTKESSARLGRRRDKAIARREFYQLVGIGGKIFISLSLVFISVASVMYCIRPKNSVSTNK